VNDCTPRWAQPGLFYTNAAGVHDWHVLAAQAIGIVCIHGATFTVAMIVFGVLNLFGRLRISHEGELEGLDLHEHGISAYPEYVISALSAPRGMGKDTVGHLPSDMASSSNELVGSKH
jgi:ammonia channel protein AmtB